jgi:signal transduction histidine kinase
VLVSIVRKVSANKNKLGDTGLSALRFFKNRGWMWGAHSRILAWYGALAIAFIGLSVPIFSQLVYLEIDRRVRDDLQADVESFDRFLKEQPIDIKTIDEEKMEDIFRDFLFRRIPEDDTFLIAFVNGKFDRSSPRGRPEQMVEDGKLMQYWARLERRTQGEQKTSDPDVGNIIYLAEPIVVNEKVTAVFVAAHTTTGEIKEAQETIFIVVQVLLVGLLMASVLGWIASSKILAPLRSLIATARSISELNLERRIPVNSSGEIGELAVTFNRMLDRLQAAFTAQKAFVSDAGHELRTPITIIRGHLELMSDDPQEQQETIALVTDELDRMSRMVDDLLLLAKSERPDFLQFETISVDALILELYSKATALAQRNWKLDAIASGNIIGDRQRLTQAVMNLAENATQYTSTTDTIALGAELNRHQLRLWVCDTGMGIAPEDQPRIFERFARGSKSFRRSEGSGLGLSIVRAIAQSHGGWVELLSTPNQGSTFTLVLPVEPPQEKLINQSKV